MIVRHLDDIVGTDRDIKAENGNWVSRRFLLRGDGMGFSFHETTIFAGTETYIWYKNHLEAVYCVGGEGEIEDLETGKTHQISDGTMYALNGHERHYLRARKDMRLICVFNPALTGSEVHDREGAYPLSDED
ncbi:MAG: ectoine synthase [Rhodospirillales bacterium]|nr:ectoine synthase [Rhodospirillales bacterium]MCW8860903.1 ectoine synthase [Rhodospirillales bacterium]MCW8952584.1 ectoine synthase [Rhodospirillales bacterium]MCW8970910.1 ectoine synthase [Rhodospirillales bacterium]MCW9001317.1 ectoine synthase [Rhodospirillales bacterium]